MIRDPNFSPSTCTSTGTRVHVGAPKLECHLASFLCGHTLSHGLQNGVLEYRIEISCILPIVSSPAVVRSFSYPPCHALAG